MVEENKDFEIIENDFKMVFDGKDRFDLYFLMPKKSKKGEPAKDPEWKLQGYNLQLSNCIKKIAYFRINKKHNTLDFKTFFKELKEMHNELATLLKDIIGNGY